MYGVKNTDPVEVRFIDLGLSGYKMTWELQEDLFEKIVMAKTGKPEQGLSAEQYLLFCEHPHVYTLGKSGSEQNLLIDHIQLRANDAEFYRIDRGGDITYHGPGQIVGYPILDLESFGLSARSYIWLLEESIIRTLDDYGIEAGRINASTGVWIDPAGKRPRKICAIGVRLSRYVSMHGFAFNINTDLVYFDYINPCGLTDKGVTSLNREMGTDMDMEEIKLRLRSKIADLFKMKFVL